MARVVVTGATGTIGSAVCRRLLERGDQPVGLSREPPGSPGGPPDSAPPAGRLPDGDLPLSAPRAGDGIEWHAWRDPLTTQPPVEALAGATGVIHLLGEPVAQRWSAAAKQRIRDSRVLSTRNLVTALRELDDERRPRVLVSQSAAGYYGPRGPEQLDEHATAGADFLAGLVKAWEQEALAVSPSCRAVVTRTGIVLTPTGGALAKMLPFFRAGVGGPVAGGRQYVPWIHIDDLVTSLLLCLDSEEAKGPVNTVAPDQVDNAEFSRALGRVLRRPAVLPVPALALKLLYGEMSMIITTGQRLVPRRLEELGSSFSHPKIEPALRSVLRPGSG